MLRRLTVENYALIDKLDLELDAHLNIITGETGAGKSILLGALGLLLGNKNESGTIRDQERNCIIEGTFDIEGYGLEAFFEDNDLDYEPQTVIRRMISPSGKSRSFVNDMPVQLSVLRELGVRLIDIHSQHRNMILSDEAFRQSALDTLAGAGESVAEYKKIYSELRHAERELEQMTSQAESLRKDEEWLRYQVEEFEAAALKAGELAEAEEELAVLENADQIGEALATVRNILDAEQIGVLEQLSAAENTIQRVKGNYPQGEEIASRLHSVVQELKDLGQTVADDSERIEANPERLQKLTERVNLIYSMCQKHRVQTLEELIAVGERLAEQLSAITHSDENIERQREKIAALRAKAEKWADKIHTLREKASKGMSKSIASTLTSLGMPEAQFIVEVVDAGELMPSGKDHIRFMFTANGRMAPQPVEKIASGGEISRVMLALKALLAEKSKLPTIIFDEIDTGVSGRIADAMGDIISRLSENMQVVAITHLPQVASKGESHFVVYKQDSRTNISRLGEDDRITEIAKMLSGSEITAAALSQARILLGVQPKTTLF
ncbi:MAG: DNA repair protein RecN [Alistipes sp.]|nr:DNA repair protein RecN [Alistipes sp.]MBO5331752.1 DNA repair protein RecN [Alistipes sp.]